MNVKLKDRNFINIKYLPLVYRRDWWEMVANWADSSSSNCLVHLLCCPVNLPVLDTGGAKVLDPNQTYQTWLPTLVHLTLDT